MSKPPLESDISPDSKLLITGARGFIGKNLSAKLINKGYKNILYYDRDTDPKLLKEYTKECDFVFHLAGVNRPKDEKEFMEGNFDFTSLLLDELKANKNKAPILISSSIQAELDNPYGKSKKAGEDLLLSYGRENGVRVCVYRLPNVFGKWCRPDYNSAVATFCNNIAKGIDIVVNDPERVMKLVYIDDVTDEFINALENRENKLDDYCYIPTVHTIKLGRIAELIKGFKAERESCILPKLSDAFVKKLYSTYLSYLSEDDFSYDLKMNIDNRGSFTEFIKTEGNGQVSVNVAKPGITKGNHWHHSKIEKFLVVKGKGCFKFRRLGSSEVIEYHVSDEKLEVIDIPPGYVHNIINEGDEELVTIIWANELFDKDNPDTFYEEV
ncbi:MAG: capsular polysaccharide biosynthesis protein CapF [Lachnospiraceae bacterium]|nr:capsular polysaccharide biosynthesis protein CapF [Lachnospiraceae bacterium]